jgi:hypothetical protein
MQPKDIKTGAVQRTRQGFEPSSESALNPQSLTPKIRFTFGFPTHFFVSPVALVISERHEGHFDRVYPPLPGCLGQVGLSTEKKHGPPPQNKRKHKCSGFLLFVKRVEEGCPRRLRW